MGRNKILFQNCVGLRTPQKAAVQQRAANLLHLRIFLALSEDDLLNVEIWGKHEHTEQEQLPAP